MIESDFLGRQLDPEGNLDLGSVLKLDNKKLQVI